MKRISLFFVLLACGAGPFILPPAAGAQQALTWDEIKTKFEASNPTMRADSLNVDEMKAQNVAFAAFLDFGMIALGAVRRALQEIKATGSIANATKDALPFPDLRALDKTQDVRDRARRWHVIE